MKWLNIHPNVHLIVILWKNEYDLRLYKLTLFYPMLYILYDGDMKIYCITRVIHYIDIKLNQKLIQQQLALKLHGAA